MHEIQTQREEHHAESCFVTLTYNQHNLPVDGQLQKSDFQAFIRSLRKRTQAKIRYYYCGEYGEKFSRPHFHAILFGFTPTDLKFHSYQQESPTYTSATISAAWKKGHILVGSATFESAAYIARYILKKQNGEKALHHYVNSDGVILNKEFTNMSLKPGIGSEYYEKYKKEIWVTDSIAYKGQEIPPPKYYSNKYEISDPEEYEVIKTKRVESALKHKADQTVERLNAREKVQLSKIKQLTREYEKC